MKMKGTWSKVVDCEYEVQGVGAEGPVVDRVTDDQGYVYELEGLPDVPCSNDWMCTDKHGDSYFVFNYDIDVDD